MTAADTETVEIPRDRYGRPLIVPPGGGAPQPYTRVSTMAKALDDLNNLMAWKSRMTAVGILRRPDLLTRVSGIVANDPELTTWPAKRDLNDVCKEATEAAGASTGASSGTGLHALTEAMDTGRDLAYVPADIQPRLDAYAAATATLEVLDVETFCVNDTVMAAGTFDRLVRLPDGRAVVADLKTGKSEASYPLATAVQIATYANAHRYDPADGSRHPLHPDLDPTIGVLIHMPPTGGCALYELDLVKGWEAARLAHQVFGVRKWRAGDIARQVVTA